jgi:hypothetical protein
MKFYDSMGFESEHGIWVRWVDAQEIAADRDSRQREVAERDARIRELEAAQTWHAPAMEGVWRFLWKL